MFFIFVMGYRGYYNDVNIDVSWENYFKEFLFMVIVFNFLEVYDGIVVVI